MPMSSFPILPFPPHIQSTPGTTGASGGRRPPPCALFLYVTGDVRRCRMRGFAQGRSCAALFSPFWHSFFLFLPVIPRAERHRVAGKPRSFSSYFFFLFLATLFFPLLLPGCGRRHRVVAADCVGETFSSGFSSLPVFPPAPARYSG